MKENNTKRVFLVCLIIMACLSIALTAEKFYWRYATFEPLKIYSIKIINPDNKAYIGGKVIYRIDFDKKMSIVPKVTRQFRNTYVYTLAPIYPPLKPLGRQQAVDSIPTPMVAEFGTFTLHWTATYNVGPEGREISVCVVSDPFEILPNPEIINVLRGERGITGATGGKGDKGDKGDKGGIILFK